MGGELDQLNSMLEELEQEPQIDERHPLVIWVRRQIASMKQDLLKDMAQGHETLRVELLTALEDHEKGAAERDKARAAEAAKELTEIRDALSRLSAVPQTMVDIASALERLRKDLEGLDGRTGAVEKAAAKEAEREEMRKEVRAEIRAESNVGPSPLIVHAGAPTPSTDKSLLERVGLPPTYVLASVFAIASALAGQAVPWPQLLTALTANPTPPALPAPQENE